MHHVALYVHVARLYTTLADKRYHDRFHRFVFLNLVLSLRYLVLDTLDEIFMISSHVDLKLKFLNVILNDKTYQFNTILN